MVSAPMLARKGRTLTIVDGGGWVRGTKRLLEEVVGASASQVSEVPERLWEDRGREAKVASWELGRGERAMERSE
jgi:hypothetical protein